MTGLSIAKDIQRQMQPQRCRERCTGRWRERAALALMVEVLSASLTGANYSFEASSLFDDKGPAPALGHFFIAIDPAAAAGDRVGGRIQLLAEEMSREEGVRLPGRRGQGLRAQAISRWH